MASDGKLDLSVGVTALIQFAYTNARGVRSCRIRGNALLVHHGAP